MNSIAPITLFVLIGCVNAFSLREEVVEFKKVDAVNNKGCTCVNGKGECHTTESNLQVNVTMYKRLDLVSCSPIMVTDFRFGDKHYTQRFVHKIQPFCENLDSKLYCVNFIYVGQDICVYMEQPNYYEIGCIKQSCIKLS